MADNPPIETPSTDTVENNENSLAELQQVQQELRRLGELNDQAEVRSVLEALTQQMSSFQARFSEEAGGGVAADTSRTAVTANAAVGAGGLSDAVRAVEAVGDGAQSGSFFSQLQGIPIDYLIATPLISAARGNMALAQVMTEFVNTIGFDKDGKTNLVTFTLDQPYQVVGEEPPQFKHSTVAVAAPLLSLVPLPALLVQGVTVDLTVQINNSVGSQQITGNTSTVGATLGASAGWGWGSASFTGSYSNTSSTNTTSTQTASQAATYNISVVAEQQAPTQGMLALSQIFANCIVPVSVGSK